MPNTEPKLYKLQKKDLVACILRVFAKLVLFSFHRITMEGLEHLPKEGPALLLPKHCTYGRDVALEAIALHRATGRYANFLMRAIASRFYEWAGGIKIARPKDVRRVPGARALNRASFEYIRWLYLQGEVLVAHPEGTRNPYDMGALKMGVIKHLMDVENEAGRCIPLVPIGIRYRGYWVPFSRIEVKIGEPVYADDFENIKHLLSYLGEQISQLSGWVI